MESLGHFQPPFPWVPNAFISYPSSQPECHYQAPHTALSSLSSNDTSSGAHSCTSTRTFKCNKKIDHHSWHNHFFCCSGSAFHTQRVVMCFLSLSFHYVRLHLRCCGKTSPDWWWTSKWALFRSWNWIPRRVGRIHEVATRIQKMYLGKPI